MNNTYEGIDPELVKIVKKTAKRAIGKSGFTKNDLPDIEQELMLSALETLENLHENVEDEQAFVSQSVGNRLKSIFRERNRKSKKWHKCCLSLNIPLELDNGDADELVNLVDTDHLFRNNSFFYFNPLLDIDLSGNLNAAIGRLPKNLRDLCEELKGRSPGEIIRESKRCRKRISRQIAEIRKILKKQECLFLRSK
jgi:RNA polymerase sigma-70 factor (ECF subfamily)